MSPVFVVGPLPPPVHGAAVITRAVADLLTATGTGAIECDTSPRATARGWRWHVSRARAYARAVRRVVAGPAAATVYVSLSGGNGLFYDLVVVIAARLRGHRVILHHHSFDYVDRARAVLRLLVRIAPSSHVHIVLCHDMGRRIRAQYGDHLRCVQVSNICFFPVPAARPGARTGLQRVGYLSNISRDKGIDRFLDVAERLARRGDIAFEIAGPFADDASRRYVEGRLASLPHVTYHGPLFGDAKRSFYDAIDVFVFPSRYANEAEPLVVYEAQAAGLPVVVTARGCLREMVDPEGGVLLDRDGIDIDAIVERLTQWKDQPESYRRAGDAATRSMARLVAARAAQRDSLLALFDRPMPAAAESAAPQPG